MVKRDIIDAASGKKLGEVEAPVVTDAMLAGYFDSARGVPPEAPKGELARLEGRIAAAEGARVALEAKLRSLGIMV